MNLMPIYSVPVWEGSYPSFDEEKNIFLSSVEEYKQENPIFDNQNELSSYQSPYSLHSKKELSPLFDFIWFQGCNIANELDFVDRQVFITSSWVNYHSSKSAIKSQHIHHDTFSGVFYLQVPEGSGKLRLTNPAMNPLWSGLRLAENKNQFTSESITINPQEGQLLIWPSYLPHSVEPNNHDEDRISISFNILMVPKNEPDSLSTLEEKLPSKD